MLPCWTHIPTFMIKREMAVKYRHNSVDYILCSQTKIDTLKQRTHNVMQMHREAEERRDPI